MGSSSRRRLVRGLLTLPALGLVAFSGAGARAASSYTATADARLVAVDFTTAPPILFDPLFDGGASVAQAQIDSLGGTAAFASEAYPGATVLGLPGLLASNGLPTSRAPSYPLVVSSDQTRPTDHRQAGTIVLDAQSHPGSSSGSVIDGATTARAMAVADPETDNVRAHAEATISSVQLGSTLTLHGVRSVADVTRTASGTIRRSSAFEVSALTILGQRVALTRDGLSLLGTEIPLGADPNSLLSSLVEALADRGTTLAFIPVTQTRDGVTSAGLRITSLQVPPPQVASGLQSSTLQVTLGRASAFVTNRAFASAGVNADLTPARSSVTDATSGLVSGTTPDPAVGTATPPTAVRPPGSVLLGAPASVAASEDSTTMATDISLGGFYPVLIFAGAVGVAVVSVIRRLGVRQL